MTHFNSRCHIVTRFSGHPVRPSIVSCLESILVIFISPEYQTYIEEFRFWAWTYFWAHWSNSALTLSQSLSAAFVAPKIERRKTRSGNVDLMIKTERMQRFCRERVESSVRHNFAFGTLVHLKTAVWLAGLKRPAVFCNEGMIRIVL